MNNTDILKTIDLLIAQNIKTGHSSRGDIEKQFYAGCVSSLKDLKRIIEKQPKEV